MGFLLGRKGVIKGQGFEVAHSSKPGHYGLQTMGERLELLGGTARITSQPGGWGFASRH